MKAYRMAQPFTEYIQKTCHKKQVAEYLTVG